MQLAFSCDIINGDATVRADAREACCWVTRTAGLKPQQYCESQQHGGAAKFLAQKRENRTATMLTSSRPSVFGRNCQCQPVRGANTREEWHWSHACKSFKRAGVGTNGILECKFLPKNEHRTHAPDVHGRGCFRGGYGRYGGSVYVGLGGKRRHWCWCCR
jgi:hypothetical protein